MTDQKATKAELTRERIVAAAMELFEERGFEKATMRLVAEQAGVSVGNVYYYFASKEELIQGYYQGLVEGFRERADEAMAEHTDFASRLLATFEAWLEHVQPHHRIAGNLFRFAVDPHSPMSPLSDESKEVRQAAIQTWVGVVEGSAKMKVSAQLRAQLPELLWLMQMGLTAFWVYDTSTKQRRTRRLITGMVPLVARLVSLSRVPLLRGTVDEALELVTVLRESG